jgi:hypothetical protein
MQKVESSSLFSRLIKKPRSGGVFCCSDRSEDVGDVVDDILVVDAPDAVGSAEGEAVVPGLDGLDGALGAEGSNGPPAPLSAMPRLT